MLEQNQPCGQSLQFLRWDIGDHNEHLSDVPDFQAVFPDALTYRRQGDSNVWNSCLDGALISNNIATDTEVSIAGAIAGGQRRAVSIAVKWPPLLEDRFL